MLRSSRPTPLAPEPEASAPVAARDERYEELRLLGRGGMGTVHLVRDRVRGQQLALKRMLAGQPGGEDPEDLLAFQREFHTLTWLKHPCVVEVFDFGVDDQGPYYTMELLGRGDLREIGPQPIERIGQILRDVTAALAFVHSRKLIHRDLSPRNVRLSDDGVAKLIDFGLLTTPGPVDVFGGTPPLVPPETLWEAPMDHRADLYSLGALGYWLIAGRHAFPARQLSELPGLWRQRPAPPTREGLDVPPSLTNLILSLLSLQPLSRPASAMEVLDRLEGLFELPALSLEATTGGYLMTPGLIGQTPALKRLNSGLDEGLRGAGATGQLVEGVTGSGKSRILGELGVAAQLKGATVVRVAASEASAGEPYALLRQIAREFLSLAPAATKKAAAPHIAGLGHVLPELRSEFGGAALAELPGEPSEDRLLIQSAVRAWLLALLADQPTVLLVDDVHVADEASMTALLSLLRVAESLRLSMVGTLRTDETPRAATALQSLQAECRSARLRPLDRQAVRELVRAMFGAVEHSERVADTVYEVAHGLPRYSIEVLRYLVAREQLRFVRGEWVFPPRLTRGELPSDFTAALDARFSALDELACGVAQSLSVLEGRLSLALCAEMNPTTEHGAVFSALDILLQTQVFAGGPSGYRFVHDGMRQAALRSLGSEAVQALHLRAARTLPTTEPNDSQLGTRVGWHLYRAGRTDEAAPLLAGAARRLFEVQSMGDARPLIEAALKAYESNGLEPAVCVELRRMLLLASPFMDIGIIEQYGERSITLAERYAGLDLATRLRHWTGRPLALAIGVTWAFFRRALTPSGRRGPPLLQAFNDFALMCGYTAVAWGTSFDVERLNAITERVDVLAAFRNTIPSLSVLFCRSLQAWLAGDAAELRRIGASGLRTLENDRRTPISDVERQTLALGFKAYMNGIRLEDLDPDWEEDLPSDDLRTGTATALGSRALFERYRGNERAAVHLAEQSIRDLGQLGRLWTTEVIIVMSSAEAYGMCRDTIGLRRCIEQMLRWQETGVDFSDSLALARGEVLREHGDYERARLQLEPLLAQLAGKERFLGQAYAALAETYHAQGEVLLAAKIARQGIDFCAAPQRMAVTKRLRCERVLALCQAAQGHPEQARERIDDALLMAETRPAPTTFAPLHEARALTALVEGNLDDAYAALQAMEDCVVETDNPALLGQVETLRAKLERAERGQAADAEAASQDVAVVLAACATPSERFARGLDVLLRASGADQGFLFRARDEQLVIVASSGGAPIQADLEQTVRRRVEALRAEATMTVAPGGAEAEGKLQMVILTEHALDAGALEDDLVLGVLVSHQAPLKQPRGTLVRAISRELAASKAPPSEESTMLLR